MNAPTDRPDPRRRPPGRSGSRLGATTVAGLVLVGLGTVLLLDRLDAVDAARLARDGWPLLWVVAGGVWALNGSRAPGLVAIAMGLLLFAANVDAVPGRPTAMIGPSILVVVGTALVATAIALAEATTRSPSPPSDVTVGATSVFGDTRFHLGDEIGGGGDAAVTTTAVFGNVNVEVPAGWRIEDRTTSLFGSVRIPSEQPTYPEAPVVTLYGSAVFGDIRARYLDATEVE